MNKKVKYSLFFSLLLIVTAVNAQIKEVGPMLSGSTADAQQLFSAYLKPYANAFGADLNGGWYNTAKNHKLLGVDLTFSISTAFVPSSDKTYNVNDLHLTGNPTITGGPLAPTVAGSDPSPKLTYMVSGKKIAEFNTPSGTGVGTIPTPMIQLGIGLVKETDIVGRFFPKVDLGNNGSIQMWGIGIKHSLKQYIPGIKMAPFFHLSFFGGYTQLKTRVGLNFQPSFFEDPTGVNAAPGTLDLDYSNQMMQLTFNSFTANIIASFDLPVVTFYGGAGFSSTSTKLSLTGNYPMAGLKGGVITVDDQFALNNPINIKMKSKDGSATKPRLNGGIKFKFAIITLHFDYTYANYSVFTGGLGLSIR